MNSNIKLLDISLIFYLLKRLNYPPSPSHQKNSLSLSQPPSSSLISAIKTCFAIEAQTCSSLRWYRVFSNPSITLSISYSSHSISCFSASYMASMVPNESLHKNPLLKVSELPPFDVTCLSRDSHVALKSSKLWSFKISRILWYLVVIDWIFFSFFGVLKFLGFCIF